MTAATYNSKAPAFAADLAEVVATYDRAGFSAASDLCGRIADRRGLDAGQRLTLADAARRALIIR